MQKPHAIEVQLDENHGVEIVEIKSECLVRGLVDGGDVSKNVSGTASAGEVLAVVHLVMVVAVVHLVMMVAVVLLAKQAQIRTFKICVPHTVLQYVGKQRRIEITRTSTTHVYQC
ncbi:hypothetical protein FQR65_LT03971 [Abscondita terminalis]|nr:hypothetical protein FQR65_LT03971 [Abscondita terminalis]